MQNAPSNDDIESINISVLILTFNEEQNIAECLESVTFSDDIVVLDSKSTDNTTNIAQKYDAIVLSREFDDYASQRNFGLSYDFKHEWILMLDADERLLSNARGEIKSVVERKKNPTTLYRMRRKDVFMGRWLKHSSGYPTWFGRLFRKGKVTVKRAINEEYYTDGKVGLMEGHLIHYPFNKGIEHWLDRHNQYSSMEAKVLVSERARKIVLKHFFSSDPMLKRKAFKAFAYRIPFRPFIVFLFLYFLKLGLLDGRAGFKFCLLRSFYEYMIDLKTNENKNFKSLN